MANTGGRSNMWLKPVSKQHVPRTRIRHGHTHDANNTAGLKSVGFHHNRILVDEHPINGGNILFRQLALLYSDLYNYGHIPHKGGRKSKTDPNNYLAITFSSCIPKSL